MKKIIFLIASAVLMSMTAISQTETPPKAEENVQKLVIKKIEQDEKNRVVDAQNEAFLYDATSKLIKNQDYANFTIIISWYKQTRTHYYYQIGWDINGQIALDYMKYNWADGSVAPVSQEIMDADTDYSKPDGSN